MTDDPLKELTYDPTGVLIPETGLSRQDLAWLAPRLEAARKEVLDDVELWRGGGPVPSEKEPLDAGFVDLPQRMLDELNRNEGEMPRILTTSDELSQLVDRVVVLGIGGSYMGARALFEACCHPFHNEQTRAQRGDRPRIYFEGNNVDNDAVQGLLDLLDRGARTTGLDENWAIVVISKSGGTLETAVAFRILLDVLRDSCGGDLTQLRRRIVPVTGQQGRLRELAAALGCPQVFSIPEGVGGRFSIFSAVGLLPAALMGLDVLKLLSGAAAMNRRFRTTPPGGNPVLDYVGVCHLIQARRGANIRVLSTWGKGLEAVGLWYDQLLAESLGKDGQGAMPLTMVNTRDLHSRGQQHQQGPRDKLITNLVVRETRRAALAVETSDFDQDKLNLPSEGHANAPPNGRAGKTLPEILNAALLGTNKAYADDRRPTAEIAIPRLDEFSLGQLFQMLMLATAVEGRLIGINPYGQPGVEAYKRNMNRILRGRP